MNVKTPRDQVTQDNPNPRTGAKLGHLIHGCTFAHAASFYEVGDFNGWTTMMGVAYYKTWSSSKTFHVGDALIFQYNKDIHNVIEVSFRDYESCNPNSALARYKSEYEPVKLNRTGHYYFICGFTGHCEDGQKLEDPLVVLSVDDATIASLPHNAVSYPQIFMYILFLSILNVHVMVASIYKDQWNLRSHLRKCRKRCRSESYKVGQTLTGNNNKKGQRRKQPGGGST
ncbi:hypothetical protein YC2023_050147 [Brassica napus]